jgi:hypothetical protein
MSSVDAFTALSVAAGALGPDAVLLGRVLSVAY